MVMYGKGMSIDNIGAKVFGVSEVVSWLDWKLVITL